MTLVRSWLLAVATLSACAPSASPSVPVQTPPSLASAPAAASPPALLVEPWEALSHGELDKARAGFASARSDPAHADEALAGLISVAAAESDEQTARGLIDAVHPENASDLLLVSAGEAAVALRPMPSHTAAIAARACSIRTPERMAVRAKDLCAYKPFAELGRVPERCTAGCATETALPLYFVASQPVVMVSINGLEPAPFVIDTGASTSVITSAFATKAGIQPLPGTEFEAQASGGVAKSARAIVSVRTDAVQVDDVPAAIIDLPFDQIGGIIAPQGAWRAFAVDFDFHAFTLKLSPAFRGEEGLVGLPYLQHEQRPMVLLQTQGRPARPIVLDTGANGTVLTERWDALGPPLERGDEVRLAGAAGHGAKAWATKADLQAQIGALSWTLRSPTITSGDRQAPGPVQSFGLLGMDLMMGRRVVMDTPGRKVWISRQARLADWPVGSTAAYSITMPGVAKPIVVSEKVVERTDDQVILDVSYKLPAGDKHFRYQMRDTWQSRGQWLITRPIAKLWEFTGKTPKEVETKQSAQMWKPVFHSFKTVRASSNPKLSFELLERGGRKMSCTTMTLPAETADSPALLSITECPAEPWRTRRIALTNRGDGRVIWLAQLQPSPP